MRSRSARLKAEVSWLVIGLPRFPVIPEEDSQGEFVVSTIEQF